MKMHPLEWLPAGVRRPGIARHLALGFGLLLLIMTGVVGVAAWQTLRLERQLDVLSNQHVPRLIRGQALARLVDGLGGAARDAIIATDPAGADAAVARIGTGRVVVGQQIEELQKSLQPLGPAGQQVATELGDRSSGILVSLVKFSRLLKAHDVDAARGLLSTTVQPRIAALGQAVDKVQALQLELLERARRDSANALRQCFVEIGAALACASGVAIVLCWRISLRVTRPVNEAVRLAERIADGDLRPAAVTAGDDELGRMQNALSAMQVKLANLVGGIRGVANQISLVSAEIASGSNDLSQRTEQTAVILQSTTSSMAQLTERVRGNAQSARDADALARGTVDVALKGGRMVEDVVARMNDISDSSRRIADITTVIDGISFQTNILALNAAVEAARAGEHGRGFAVVAGEVRSLARRAAEASREIKTLICTSVEKVDSGCQLVRTAGGTMTEIVSGASDVTGLIGGISTASVEQSGDLDQVNETVGRLDEMTQQNSALVEQSSAAAQSMLEQAQRLLEMMKVFRTADHELA